MQIVTISCDRNGLFRNLATQRVHKIPSLNRMTEIDYLKAVEIHAAAFDL